MAAFEAIPLDTLMPISFYCSQREHKINFVKEMENFRPIAEETTDSWKNS